MCPRDVPSAESRSFGLIRGGISTHRRPRPSLGASPMPSSEQCRLINEAPHFLTVSRFQVFACALQVWDILLTYSQEIELVWKVQACAVNYLFFMIRYLALVQSIVTIIMDQTYFKSRGNSVCEFYTWYSQTNNIVLVATLDVLLIYRVYALYGRNRTVLVGLVLLWTVNIGLLLTFTIWHYVQSPMIRSPLTSFKPGVFSECNSPNIAETIHGTWISELVFQSFLFLLVLIKLLKIKLSSWRSNALRRFFCVFVRDEFWCFCLVVAIFLVSVVQTNPDIKLIQSAIVLMGIAGSRLVLNLRNLQDALREIEVSKTYVFSTVWTGREVIFDFMPDLADVRLDAEPQTFETSLQATRPISPSSDFSIPESQREKMDAVDGFEV